jgi:hypothetical protein
MDSRLPVRLIVFLATPHRGIDVDALRTLIQDEPPKQLIEELAPNSALLRRLHFAFRKVLGGIQISSVFETRRLRRLCSMLVTARYSTNFSQRDGKQS